MSGITTETDELKYFISEKKHIMVVTLIGPLVRSNAHILDQCIRELSRKEASWVILNLKDVPGTVDRAVFPAIARLQKNVRDRKAQLRLSSINPNLRLALDQNGLIRSDETSNTLAEALTSLQASPQQAA